jgi:hypothetical protein
LYRLDTGYKLGLPTGTNACFSSSGDALWQRSAWHPTMEPLAASLGVEGTPWRAGTQGTCVADQHGRTPDPVTEVAQDTAVGAPAPMGNNSGCWRKGWTGERKSRKGGATTVSRGGA